MPVKTFRPLTPSLRYRASSYFSDITKKKPEKRLVQTRKKTGGRNSYGRLTARGIGGGHKQKIRSVDFKREKHGVEAVVAAIEYDPLRSARLALLEYKDGEKRYIVAPAELKVGDPVIASASADIKPGNAMPLRHIPLGSLVHNIELRPGKGAQMVRSAGTYAQLMAKEGDYAQVRLPSGEVRKVHIECKATIGQVGNATHEGISLGKAGRTRWLGRTPRVRGVAMNPIDHPMGGGEGKTSGGRHPCTPWGVPTKGYKTRRNKTTDKYIIKKRGKK